MSIQKSLKRYLKKAIRSQKREIEAVREFMNEVHIVTWDGTNDVISFESPNREIKIEVYGDAEMQRVYELLKTVNVNTFEWRKLVRYIRNIESHTLNEHAYGVADQIQAASELPKTAEKLLYIILPKSAREHLPGDLEEEYRTTILPKFGSRYAKIWYWKQAVGSIGPIIRSQLLKLLGFASVAKVAQWVSQRFGF